MEEEVKTEFSYFCDNCEEQLTVVLRGSCPLCGSQAVFPVGWYKLPADARTEWFQRIRGERWNEQASPVALHWRGSKPEKPGV